MLALVLSRIVLFIVSRIHDVATSVIFQFCSTFAVWILAERLHLSGILTVVVLAMALCPTVDGDVHDAEVIRLATAAERRRLIGLRDDGTIGDAAFQCVEEELDRRELDLHGILAAGAES